MVKLTARRTRLTAILGTTLAGALALSGCTSSPETEAGSSASTAPSASTTASAAASTGEWPRTFTNADGTTTEIPAQPENILSTSVSVTGSLLAIDAPVTASAAAANGNFFAQWTSVAEERGVETLWSAGSDFDAEAVSAADPDLIVVSTSGADSLKDYVADLQAIAPTILVDYGNETWQELALQLGEAAGIEEQAEAAIQEFDDYVAAAAATITVPSGEANIISFNGAGEDNPVGKNTGPHAQLLTALGFTIEEPDEAWHTSAQQRNDFVWTPYENLVELTAETTFILSNDNDGENVANFTNDPALANLPSVQSGQVYGLGKNSFRIDKFSATEIVDGIVANFGS